MTVITDRAPLGLHDLDSLIPSALFDRLAGRVERDADVDRPLAERIVRQALAFLVACARDTGSPLAPSRTVDAGWHAFILHTREYADFCDRLAGRFIHHAPDEESGVDRTEAAARTVATVDVMRRIGLPVDEDLWTGHEAACSSECQRCCQGHH
jgi:hypothetical protein